MKQYSSYGCNIFAFNILVKDRILCQYEVLCTTDAVTCITCQSCNNGMHCDLATVQGKTGRDQVNYHSSYNSFTAWPRHKFTFNFYMQSCKKIHSDELKAVN